MVLEELWRLLEENVFNAPSTELLFNPYFGVNSELDRTGADVVRRENLRRYLESFPTVPPILLVGEAPGPRGCRFSGVPFTSEAQLLSGRLPFGGRQSSSRPEPYREYSATSVWPVLIGYHPRFLLWNCVPLHPHMPGRPLSIRNPKTSEVRQWAAVLRQIWEILRPDRVVALGRKAEEALRLIGVERVYLRHPSQGGLREFREGVPGLLG